MVLALVCRFVPFGVKCCKMMRSWLRKAVVVVGGEGGGGMAKKV
jgi:hypothetical protein